MQKDLQALARFFKHFAKDYDSFSATMGDGAGNVAVSGRPGWIHARMPDGAPIIVFNGGKVPEVEDLGITIGYDKSNPKRLHVLDVQHTYEDLPYPVVGPHASTHKHLDPSGGNDVLYIDARQWMPLRVGPGGGLNIRIYRSVIWTTTGWAVVEGLVDLSAHVPTSGARYVLVSFDTSGAVQLTDGSTVASPSLLDESDIPALPVGRTASAAVALYAGQTEIVESQVEQDFSDVRFSGAPNAGSAHNLLSATHLDTVAATPVRGDMIVANATGWARKAIGATATIWQSDGTDPSWVTISGDATLAVGGALTLANTAVTPGTYGSASQVAQITVDSKGRLTAASNVSISGFVPTSRLVTAGAGLTGGGDLSADITLNVGAPGDGSIVVNANDIQVATGIQSGAALGLTAVQPGRTLTAGAGLTGGGDLSADRTFTVGQGVGITVNADDVALTVPVVVTNGGTGTATQFTAGSVVFAGTSGVYSQDNANIFWNDTDNYFGLGTPLPLFPLHVVREFSAPSANNIVGDYDAYDDPARYALRRANGTVASPTKLLLNNSIGGLSFRGYHGGGGFHTSGAAALNAFTSEDYDSSTTQGCYLSLAVTPTGTATQQVGLLIGSERNVGIGILTNTNFGTGAVRNLVMAVGTAPSTSVTDGFQLWEADHNGVAGQGWPHVRVEDGTNGTIGITVAKVDLANQEAAITDTTLYAVPAGAGGTYVVHWVATVTRAATTSSVLGGTNGFQVKYTDKDDSVEKTMPGTIVAGVETNSNNSTVTGTISGSYTCYAKASTNLKYLIDYTSVGLTSMQFNLHIVCRRLN